MRTLPLAFLFALLTVTLAAAQDSPSLEFKPVPKDVRGKRYIVRIAYAIPKNREARPEVIKNVQALIPWLQNWYADQMEGHGYGRKTFQLETSPGEAPPVHLVRLPGPDTEYQTDVDASNTKVHSAAWLKILKATRAAGVPIGRHGQIWLVLTELHEQKPDGSIIARINRGGPWSKNNHDGAGTAATTLLGLANEVGMSNTRAYNGMKIAEVGPYPMKFDVTFSEYHGGRTLGRAISAETASMMHELSHAFGLKHNNLNDTTAAGNLMGVGYRGIRSEIYSRRFPGEYVNLSPASAALLNHCRQFNYKQKFNDKKAPELKSVRVSSRAPGGLLTAVIEATDDKSLGHAFFLIDGDVVADAPMEGTQMKLSLPAYKYRTGKSLSWQVRVYDAQGKWIHKSGKVSVDKRRSHAPIPSITASRFKAKVGQQVTLDASGTKDPDSKRLQIQWDTNGDGEFDTPASNQPKHTVKFDKPGHYRIRAQVSDGRNKSVTPPIVIAVEQ